MLAVDTNVVVRYLTADDPVQFAHAVAIVEGAGTFVSLTVVLEAEWVLRSAYRYTPTQIVHALRGFAGLPLVTVESADLVSIALEWVEDGMDFADALHLAQAQFCEAFVTFDRDLVQRAVTLSDVPVRLP
jgi:predicted nucleic-acid-binding protein